MKGRASRLDHRKNNPVSPWYFGWVHLAVINVVSILVAGAFLLQLADFVWHHALCVPFAVLISNFAEYVIHRYPMHKVLKVFGKGIYKKHSGKHHKMFTYDEMAMIDSKDLREILTLPRHTLELFIFVIAPMSFLLAFFSWNIGMIFGATAVLYYLAFEWIHLASHLPKKHWIARLPVMRNLCEHHRLHHNPRVMHKKNFNIAFPIMDKLFGTEVVANE